MSILGTQITSPTWPGLTLDHTTNNQRALVLAAFTPSSPGYATALGVTARRSGGSAPNVYVALWSLDSSGQPTALLASTAKMTVPTGTAGTVLEGGVTPARLVAGTSYALGVLLLGADAEFATLPGQAAVTQYRRTMASGTTPRNPFGVTSNGVDLPIAVYAQFTADSAPAVTLSTPAAAAATTASPPFTAAFSDADASLGDGLASYEIQVRVQSAATNLWDASFTATATERLGNTPAPTYAGPTLAADGTVYEWRMQVRDDSGVASIWTGWRSFTVNPLGLVDTSTATSPAAKVDTDPAAIDYGGHWSHPTHLNTNAVQVRILLADGVTVIRTGGIVAQTVSGLTTGADFTVAHAASGIGALPGGTYTYQIAGRATDSQWSPWSTAKTFAVNSAPTTPSNLQPPSGAASTSLPILQANCLDPDSADVAHLTLSIVLTRPDSTTRTITVPNASYDSVAGVFSYQTTVVDCNQFGTYQWTAQGVDAAAPAFNPSSAVSKPSKFSYVNGPTVTVTTPASGAALTTSVPTVNFSASSGTFGNYAFDVYLADAAAPFKSTGKTSTGGSVSSFAAAIPAGWLKNGTAYDLVVSFWDGSNNKWSSLRIPFSVSYPAAVALQNVIASTTRHRRDQADTSILIAWDETNYPKDSFGGYIIRRRNQGDDLSAATVLRVLTAPGQSQFIDYHAPPDVGLTYSVSQLFKSGSDTQESPATDVDATLALQFATLVSVRDPESTRSQLVFLLNDAYQVTFARPEQGVVTWGSNGKETLISTPADYGKQTFDLTVTVVTDTRGQMIDHYNDLRQLATNGRECCFRSSEGERAFVRIANFQAKRKGAWRLAREVTLSLVEISFTEEQVY